MQEESLYYGTLHLKTQRFWKDYREDQRHGVKFPVLCPVSHGRKWRNSVSPFSKQLCLDTEVNGRTRGATILSTFIAQWTSKEESAVDLTLTCDPAHHHMTRYFLFRVTRVQNHVALVCCELVCDVVSLISG